jgi:hypothetical protein
MTAFGLLVKSYAPDLPYVERLVASLRRHNVEQIPVHVVVPQADVAAFAPVVGDAGLLHPEETFADHLTAEPVAGFGPGYINQEIVKLAFWETGLADNYFCVDSELEFVRDFGRADFMADDTTPFTFLSADAELQVEPDYHRTHWVARRERLRVIQREIGIEDEPLLTVHGHATFSATVLAAFRDRFLAPRGWDYVDALACAPYEPTWYSLWLQKDQTIPIVMREPIVKTFHDPAQYLDYVVRGVTVDDVARGYVAMVLNSNYSRGDGVIGLGDDPAVVAARYVPVHRLVAALLGRALAPARSVLSRATTSGVTRGLHRQLSRTPES